MFIFKNSFNQKTTAILLVFSIIGMIFLPPLFYSKKSEAYGVDEVIDIFQMVLQAIWQVLDMIWQAAMKVYNAISAYVDMWMKSKTILTWIAGVLLNLLLHQILAQLTNDIVNWIQNGTTPRFLTMGLDDWLGMAVDNVLGNFIDQYLGMGWLCDSFDISIKLALLKPATFKEDARCSLSDIVDNIGDFFNDFSKGGWKGWVKLTEKGNNFYGAFLLAQDEANKITLREQENQDKEIERGSGFFSPKDCIWFDANDRPIDLEVENTGRKYTLGYKDVWGTASLPSKCQPDPSPDAEPFDTIGGIEGPCYVKCISHTPGQTISDGVSKTLNRFWDTINAQIGAAATKAGPLSIYVQAILTALVERVFKEGYGLLFAENEAIPEYGDPGMSNLLPDVVDPTEIAEDYIAVELIKEELDIFTTKLNDLLVEQEKNKAVLDQILIEYQAMDKILDDILDPVNGCDEATKAWATNKKIEIGAEITSLEAEIAALATDIANTNSAISGIGTLESLIADYEKKYEEFEDLYDQYSGMYDPNDPDDPLTKVMSELDDLKEDIIEQLQLILTYVNGSCTSTSLPGLEEEKNDTIGNITLKVFDLQEKRGDPTSEEAGTLYGRLRIAREAKEEAQEKLGACGTSVFLYRNHIYSVKTQH